MSIIGEGLFNLLGGETWMRGAVCPSTDAEIFFPGKRYVREGGAKDLPVLPGA